MGPARRRLDVLGYGGRVHIKQGDGYLGWPEKAPFDAILVTASPPEIPQALKDQLADGGRMVLPLELARSNQVLIRLTRQGDQFDREEILPVRFVPMVYGEDVGE